MKRRKKSKCPISGFEVSPRASIAHAAEKGAILAVRLAEIWRKSRDFPDAVMITREHHPFEGCALAVIGSIRRRGVLFALACLPDGSRVLIPAQWTDWEGY
jgi:hypothetical protein